MDTVCPSKVHMLGIWFPMWQCLGVESFKEYSLLDNNWVGEVRPQDGLILSYCSRLDLVRVNRVLRQVVTSLLNLSLLYCLVIVLSPQEPGRCRQHTLIVLELLFPYKITCPGYVFQASQSKLPSTTLISFSFTQKIWPIYIPT